MKTTILIQLILGLHARPDSGQKINLPLLIPKANSKFEMIDSIIYWSKNTQSRVIMLIIK